MITCLLNKFLYCLKLSYDCFQCLSFKVKEDICLLFINGKRMPLYWHRRRAYLRLRSSIIWSQGSYYLSRYRNAKVTSIPCLLDFYILYFNL